MTTENQRAKEDDLMLTKVRSVGIYVSDQQRALDFFTEALGCVVLADLPLGEGPEAPRWIEVGIPGDPTRLILFTPEGQEDRIGSFSNVIFQCDDIERTYEELSARGVEFTTKPELASWGRWWAVFADPDGNQYGLGVESEG
jgi:catechol 2,3-dioxygenase-like lactoylglutathione lyase family enzyme